MMPASAGFAGQMQIDASMARSLNPLSQSSPDLNAEAGESPTQRRYI
jgi:hypothetical protein